jgi:predicted nuclease of restriction endonuclease-like (RecB) superfamily
VIELIGAATFTERGIELHKLIFMEENVVPFEYKQMLNEIKARIKSSQTKAALAVNRTLILLYWNIGKLILQKQTEHAWGSQIIERLSQDLKAEFPGNSGFSARNLRDTRRFYVFYSNEIVRQAVAKLHLPRIIGRNVDPDIEEKFENQTLTILQQLVAEIPWGHHLLILNKVSDPDAALFYISQIIENNWSRSVLSLHIKQKLFDRQGKALSNFKETLPEQQALLAQQILKDPYNFSFLSLESQVQEIDLEKQLTEQITRFLLELGKGFAFLGRQFPIKVGEKEYFLDLLFYHIRLRCFVVIELKVTEFEPEYAGKMNFYLSVIDDLLKDVNDQPTIGILLCKNKATIEVEYALRGINKPIGVSEFTLTEALPDELKSSIPTVEEFEEEINRLSEQSS